MNNFDLTGFRIILPPQRGISLSEIRVSPTQLSFSPITVAELQYSAHICMMYSEEQQSFLISPSVEAPYTLPFYCPDQNKTSTAVVIRHKALAHALRAQMKWGGAGTFRIPGIRVPGTNYLAFDLKAAECGRRKAGKVDPESFLRSCPSIEEITQPNNYAPVLALPSIEING